MNDDSGSSSEAQEICSIWYPFLDLCEWMSIGELRRGETSDIQNKNEYTEKRDEPFFVGFDDFRQGGRTLALHVNRFERVYNRWNSRLQ